MVKLTYKSACIVAENSRAPVSLGKTCGTFAAKHGCDDGDLVFHRPRYGSRQIQWAPYPDPNVCSGGIGMEQQRNGAEDTQATPAKLWWRLVAFIVDSVILATPLMGVDFVYLDQSVALGEWGRLLGFTAGVLYFTVSDSAWGGGWSPGKRLLRIGVIASDCGSARQSSMLRLY